MDGIYVVMRSATSLVAVIGGERYVARFLFTPAVLRPGDRIWLRVEKMLDGTEEELAWGMMPKASAADVTARITRLLGKNTSLVRPHTGLTFFMTIDEFGAVTPGDEATRQRYGQKDGGGATDVEDAPTEKLMDMDFHSAVSSMEATQQDTEFDIACGDVRWSA